MFKDEKTHFRSTFGEIFGKYNGALVQEWLCIQIVQFNQVKSRICGSFQKHIVILIESLHTSWYQLQSKGI